MNSGNITSVRLSSVFLIVGGGLVLVGGATHGDLPEVSGSAALAFVADHPAYALVHFVSILGAVIWSLGLAGWHMTRSPGAGQWLAQAGGRAALIGAAVLAVQFSVDGVGMKALAVMWAEADASKSTFEAIARIAPEALVGTAFTWVVLLYGLPLILLGWSLTLDDVMTLGWTGVALGVFSVVGGLSLVFGFDVMADWLVFAGSTIGVSVWIVSLGILTLTRMSPAALPVTPPVAE